MESEQQHVQQEREQLKGITQDKTTRLQEEHRYLQEAKEENESGQQRHIQEEQNSHTIFQ